MPAATLTGYEALSRPFRYVLEHYPDEQPDLAALIGKPYTVRLPMPDGSARHRVPCRTGAVHCALRPVYAGAAPVVPAP